MGWDEELKKKVLPSLEKDELNLETETSKESASEDLIETNDEEISITHPPRDLSIHLTILCKPK